MRKNQELNKRQEFIVNLARQKTTFQTKDIFDLVHERFDIERLTLVRDLSFLEECGILSRQGKGRAVSYIVSQKHLVQMNVDAQEYFSRPFNERGAGAEFNQEIFVLLEDVNIFTKEELDHLETRNKKYIRTKSKLEQESPAILKREWKRLIIELSWKSSEIEGNTYTLLETEVLIKEAQLAKGKDKSDAQMIMNHKKALEYILKNKEEFTVITLEKIKKIHSILVEDIDIKNDFRNHPVGITGTLYRPPAKRDAIEGVMHNLVKFVDTIQDPFVKAFIFLIMVSYVQPFEDGNKRTARILANALLYANNKSMLSYRNVEAIEYKKAMLLFYERNNISYIKRIFMEQFDFAVENYFG